MAFVRTKKIKNKEYAYIVENKYRKRGNPVKQKTKKYLGRVYRFERKNDFDFFEFYSISDNISYLDQSSKKKLMLDLIKFELVNHGFKEEDGKFVNGDCVVDGKKISAGHPPSGKDPVRY